MRKFYKTFNSIDTNLTQRLRISRLHFPRINIFKSKPFHIPFGKVTLGLLFVLAILLLCLFIKGDKGNPLHFQNDFDSRITGPFEATNSTSRYALTQAIVDDHSYFLSNTLARFAAPDIAYYNNHFISLFTPGVSLLGIPFYMVGKLFHAPELFTFSLSTLVSILDVILIALISKKLGTSFILGLFGGLCFLFATDALAYSVTFTQHPYTVAVLLLSFLLSLYKRTWKNTAAIGALFGLSILFDIPNLFILLPVMLYAFFQYINFEKVKGFFKVSFNFIGLFIILGILPFIIFFAYYNHATTNSYTKVAQFIGRTNYLKAIGQVKSLQASAPTPPVGSIAPVGLSLPFDTRLQLNGVYILLFSDERSWMYYSPILFTGIVGLFLLYKNKQDKTPILVLFGIVLIDITLYSMFGDPWGGWSFGPRYLLPAASILSIGIAPVIERYKKNILAMVIFFALLIYSLWVNVTGALTTSSIPPKIEAIHLSHPIPYTYLYNQQIIASNKTSSLLYNLFLTQKMSVNTYVNSILLISIFIFIALYVYILLKRKGELHV